MLSAQDLSYRIGGRFLLKGLSLQVEAGQVLAVVGQNGAGKSTLLKLLAGDLRPTSGEVRLWGKPLHAYRPAELALLRAVMGQDILPPYGFTAYEVARLGRYPHQRFGRTQADDHALTLEALRQTDSESLAERQFATLSGGERARVTLARVLAQGTRLLLLDEPSATLDLRHQQALMRLLRRLAAEGCAIVLSLHDLNLAAVYADTLALLRGGALYAYGTPCAVLTPANIEAVFGLQALVLPHPRLGESVPLIVPS